MPCKLPTPIRAQDEKNNKHAIGVQTYVRTCEDHMKQMKKYTAYGPICNIYMHHLHATPISFTTYTVVSMFAYSCSTEIKKHNKNNTYDICSDEG